MKVFIAFTTLLTLCIASTPCYDWEDYHGCVADWTECHNYPGTGNWDYDFGCEKCWYDAVWTAGSCKQTCNCKNTDMTSSWTFTMDYQRYQKMCSYWGLGFQWNDDINKILCTDNVGNYLGCKNGFSRYVKSHSISEFAVQNYRDAVHCANDCNNNPECKAYLFVQEWTTDVANNGWCKHIYNLDAIGNYQASTWTLETEEGTNLLCVKDDIDCDLGDMPEPSQCTSACGTLTQAIEFEATGNGVCQPQTYECQHGDGECIIDADCELEALTPSMCTADCGTLEQNILEPATGSGMCMPETYVCQHGDGQCIVDADCELGSLEPSTCPLGCGTIQQAILEPATGAGLCEPQTYECQHLDGECVIDADCELGSLEPSTCPLGCGTIQQAILEPATGSGLCEPQTYECQHLDGQCVIETSSPSVSPSVIPSYSPSKSPLVIPSVSPSVAPSVIPSFSPSVAPSVIPTFSPSASPSMIPTAAPVVIFQASNSEQDETTENDVMTMLCIVLALTLVLFVVGECIRLKYYPGLFDSLFALKKEQTVTGGSMMSIMESLPSLPSYSRKATDQSAGGVEIDEDFQIEMTVVTEPAKAESDIKTTAPGFSRAFADTWSPTSNTSDRKDAVAIELQDNESENDGAIQSFWVMYKDLPE